MKKLARVSWIDQMRGLAMMCVYFAHVGISTNYYGLFTYWFIPIFFFLSGYLHNDEVTKNKFKIRIINRILIPYVLFTTLSILSQISNVVDFNYFLESLITLLKGRGNWFFACITIVELLAYYISKLILIYPQWRRKIILFVMASGFIGMNIVKPRSEIWWHADTAICTMTYYYSGYIFRHSSLSLCKKNWNYIILPLLIMLSMLIYTNKMLDFNVSINIFGEPWLNLPLSISGCIFTALFLQKVNLGRFFSYIGENTVWLFGINYYTLSIIDKISNIIGIAHFNPYIYAPIKVMLSIILGGLLVIPINKWFPWANGRLQ